MTPWFWNTYIRVILLYALKALLKDKNRVVELDLTLMMLILLKWNGAMG